MTKTRRKPNTALVINPKRGLSLKGRTVRRNARKSNAFRASSVTRAAKANPARRTRRRRVSNPITSATQLIIAAFMGGLGLAAFDVAASKALPTLSPVVRIGVKGGVAFLVSSYGQKIPILGGYKNEIALLILGSAALDVMKLWLFPMVTQAAAQFGLAAAPAQPQLVAVPHAAANDGTTAGYYPQYAQ